MFLTRLISTLIALPIFFLILILAPKVYFDLFIILALMVIVYETSKFIIPLEGIYEKLFYSIFTISIFSFFYFNLNVNYFLIIFSLYFVTFLLRNAALNWKGTTIGRKTLRRNYTNMVAIFLVGIYLGAPFALICKIRTLENGIKWLLIILITTWAGDTGAYLVGKWLKRYFPPKLFPIVSPNKTWIGSVGSFLCAILSVFLLNHFFKMNIPFKHLIIIILILNIFGQMGDLFESFIKRVYQVKDSGNLIPGHGGILDSIDAATFTVPPFYFYLTQIFYG